MSPGTQHAETQKEKEKRKEERQRGRETGKGGKKEVREEGNEEQNEIVSVCLYSLKLCCPRDSHEPSFQVPLRAERWLLQTEMCVSVNLKHNKKV